MAGVAPGSLEHDLQMGPGGHDGFIEGAMTTMLVFKRLAALAVTIGAILAGAGIALAGDGQPSPWQLGFQQSATPGDGQHRLVPHLLLYVIIAISLFVLALLVTIMVRFNARANPTPVAHHPQHPARGRLDADPGGDPGRHRDPVVPAAVLSADHSGDERRGRRRHDQGDRQAVVLELQLSGPRQFRVRTRCMVAIRSAAQGPGRGCWPSTTRWWCR